MVGDLGKYRKRQRNVAHGMSKWAQQTGSKFIISTGDNFYPNGISYSAGSKVEQWRHQYSRPGLSNLTWYITLGNHDHAQNIFSGVGNNQYKLHKVEPHWHLPGPHYYFAKRYKNQTVLFISIDSLHFIQLKDRRKLIIEFISQTLSNIAHDWSFIISHYPIYMASHVNPPINYIIEQYFIPLFQKYKVDFYLSGHDHDLEHFKKQNIPTHFIISGTGSRKPDKFNTESESFLRKSHVSILGFWKMLGFVSVTIREDKSRVDFVSEHGESFYTFSVNKQHRDH